MYRRYLSESEIEEIMRMSREENLNGCAIAKKMQIPSGTVYYWLLKEGRRSKMGRPRITDRKLDVKLEEVSEKNSFKTAADLRGELAPGCSVETAWNRPEVTDVTALKVMAAMQIVKELELSWDYVIMSLWNKVFIHPECSRRLLTLLCPDENVMALDELSSRVLGFTHSSVADVFAFVQKLDVNREFNLVFAVDGFGKDYKDYVQHLQYPLEAANVTDAVSAHVKGVRELYKNFNLTPEEVRSVITKVMYEGPTDEKTSMYMDAVKEHMEDMKLIFYAKESVLDPRELIVPNEGSESNEV